MKSPCIGAFFMGLRRVFLTLKCCSHQEHFDSGKHTLTIDRAPQF